MRGVHMLALVVLFGGSTFAGSNLAAASILKAHGLGGNSDIIATGSTPTAKETLTGIKYRLVS